MLIFRVPWHASTESCPILTNRLQWNIIHSNGIPLVKAISLRGLEYFPQLQAARGCILLVHWYDWYQWNIINSKGIPFVICISLRGLKIFSTVSGCEGLHSTCPLVRLVRLVPMEYYSFQWYSIGDMHIITATSNIAFGFML